MTCTGAMPIANAKIAVVGAETQTAARALRRRTRAQPAQPVDRATRLRERFHRQAERLRAREEIGLAGAERVDAHRQRAVAILEQPEEDFGVAEHDARRKDETDAARARDVQERLAEAPAERGQGLAPAREDALVVRLVLDRLHERLVDESLERERAVGVALRDEAI